MTFLFIFLIYIYKYRDPSIDCNTHLVPNKKQSNQVFCGVISNELKSRVIDIKKEKHYNTWVQAQNIYNGLNCVTMYRKQTCHLECIIYDLFCSNKFFFKDLFKSHLF